MVTIKRLNCDGTIENAAFYSGNDAQKSLIAFIQAENGNFNTFCYPETMPQVFESKTKKGVYHYQHNKDCNIAYSAFPYEC